MKAKGTLGSFKNPRGTYGTQRNAFAFLPLAIISNYSIITQKPIKRAAAATSATKKYF